MEVQMENLNNENKNNSSDIYFSNELEAPKRNERQMAEINKNTSAPTKALSQPYQGYFGQA